MGFGLALLAVATGDPPLLPAIGISALVGLLIGAPLGAVQGGLARRSSRTRNLVWIVVGAAWGEYLATEIGLFTRAGQQTSRLALVALVAAACGALSFGTLLALAQPLGERAPLFGRPRVRFIIVGASLIVGLAVATYETSAWWLRSYPGLRLGLVSASWLLSCSAIVFLLELSPRRPRYGATLGWAALSVPGLVVTFSAPPEKIARLSGAPQLEHVVRLLRRATDVDRDGFSSLFAGGDCAAFDSSVNPNARELPDNGLDDNCRYGDAKGIPRAPATTHPPGRPSPVNVLLVTIDSLRMDRTTPYGYSRNTTPHLAELARRSTLFRRAYTSGGWTCLALPSMLMGSYPRRMPFRPLALTWEHDLLELPFEPRLREGDNFRLMVNAPRPESAWLLHRALAERGMKTVAVYSWYVRYVVDAIGGGWDRQVSPSREEDSDRRLTDLALAELEGLRGKPFFMWVHYFDPHDPPTKHDGIPEFGTARIDLYDHEVASSDHELGRLVTAVDALKERPTVIVVAADHGEAFEPAFQFHGVDLFEESVRIPLVLRSGAAPRVVESPVSLVDIAPTLLRLTRSTDAPNLDGVDLEAPLANRIVLTDLWRLDPKAEPEIDLVGATNHEHRLVLDRKAQATTLFSTNDWRRPPEDLSSMKSSSRLHEALNTYEEYHVGGP
jgi:hypothetical protein